MNILFECFSKLLPKACGISEEVRSKNDSSTRFLYEYFLVFSVIAKSFPVKDDKASDKLFTLLEFTVDCIEQLETRETTVEFPDERGIRCKSTTDYTLYSPKFRKYSMSKYTKCLIWEYSLLSYKIDCF